MGNVVNFMGYVGDSLTNLVSRMGTGRDKASSNAFVMPLLMDQEILDAYRGSWLPRKIVDIPAFDSVRAWRDWQADGPQIEAIEAEENRLNVRGKVLDARVKARLWGGAAIHIGNGDQDLAQPLEVERMGRGSIKHLTVLTRRQLRAGEVDRDPASEWFGRPRVYTLTAGDKASVDIHPSRLVIFTGKPPADIELAGGGDMAWGDSVLLSVMDAIKQAEGTAANIASLVFEAKIDIIKVPNFMASLKDEGYRSKLIERFTLAATTKGINGTLVLDKEEEYETKTATFATLPDVLDRFLQIASGAADIPATRLLGQAPAGMNSTGESDLRNYYDRLSAEQSVEMTPAMHRMDEAIIRSALGSRPAEIYYDWSPLWGMSEKEKADVFKIKADAARVIAGTGGASPSLMPIEALSDALVNMLVEDGSLPGLEAAIEEFGRLADQEEDEDDVAAAAAIAQEGNVRQLRVAANDAAPRTLYVRRDVMNAAEILAWAKSQGFKSTLEANDLHVTIAYSRTPVDWFAVGESWSPKLEVGAGGPRQMERFGKATVLLFTVSDLRWRHNEIKEAGASWDHDEYQPHITISYEADDVDLTKVEPYQGKIVLGPERFEEVNEDWQSTVKET